MSENPSVHISRKYKELYYDRYTDPKKEKIFDRMIDLFLLSASIGFIKGKEKPTVIKESDSPFKWSNFNKLDIVLIKSICLLYDQKDPQILLDNEKMMNIIELYAEGGIEDVIKILDKEGNKAINLLEFLHDHDIERLYEKHTPTDNI